MSYFIFRKPDCSPVIKHVTNTHNFLVGDSLDVVCVIVCLHDGDDDTNYFSTPALTSVFSKYRPQVLSWLRLPPNCWCLPVEVWTLDTRSVERRALRTFTGPRSSLHPELRVPSPSPINWRHQGGSDREGSWGWYNSAGVGVVFCQPTLEI